MSDGQAFRVTVETDGGDSKEVETNPHMQMLAFMEKVVALFYPGSHPPVTEYDIVINEQDQPYSAWGGKTVGEMDIGPSTELVLLGPAPKGVLWIQ